QPPPTLRLRGLGNSGLTYASAPDSSQDARKISMETAPMSACSYRAPNDFGAADLTSAAARASLDVVTASMEFIYATVSIPVFVASSSIRRQMHCSSWRNDG